CPGPIVNLSKEIKNIEIGDQIEVTVTDPGFLSDIKSWSKQTGHSLVKLEENHDGINAIIQKEKPKELEVNHTAKGTTIVLFSRSEEHTSELQSRFDLVCRLLLEKKKTSNKGSCILDD